MLVFVVGVLLTVIGNLVLTSRLSKMGIEVPFLLQGSTLFLYPFFRPKSNPKATDRLAFSVAIAFVAVILVVYFVGDDIWSDGPAKPLKCL